jgi:hypothetical protein
VFTRFVEEEDRVPAFDLHGGAIAELDRPMNPKVDFGERGLGTTHVVCGSGVEDPLSVVVVPALSDLREGPHSAPLTWSGGRVRLLGSTSPLCLRRHRRLESDYRCRRPTGWG